jgi:hypothetical protein
MAGLYGRKEEEAKKKKKKKKRGTVRDRIGPFSSFDFDLSAFVCVCGSPRLFFFPIRHETKTTSGLGRAAKKREISAGRYPAHTGKRQHTHCTYTHTDSPTNDCSMSN